VPWGGLFTCNRGVCENTSAGLTGAARGQFASGYERPGPLGPVTQCEMKSAAPGFPRAPPQSLPRVPPRIRGNLNSVSPDSVDRLDFQFPFRCAGSIFA
jgi:hypothetical protein